MSEDKTSPDRNRESNIDSAAMQDADMQSIHSPQLKRERKEPHERQSPIPISLLTLISLLAFWGGYYFSNYSQDFRWDAYDPYAKGGLGEVVVEEKTLAEIGARVFRGQCVACHQNSGLGVAGAFPPLVNSEWVLGDEERLARILINGLNGEIAVLGDTYNGNMPAFGPHGLNLKPKQIAAVLTYIRQTWGNNAPEVTVEALEGYHAAYGSRTEPWTAEELLADFPMK
ncbi:MAG: Cytochrome c-552 [Opitutia bacterium UBA7350]|nr:MAG: Cytochrome c-552 [Opitutae bacterium UBA7350]